MLRRAELSARPFASTRLAQSMTHTGIHTPSSRIVYTSIFTQQRCGHTYVRPWSETEGKLSVDVQRARGEKRACPLSVNVGFLQTFHTWRPIVRELARDRDVIVFETRAQGQTSLPISDESLNFDQIVDDIDAGLRVVLPELGYAEHEQVDVCGFSFGALTGLGLANRHPSRVRRLVLTGLGDDESRSRQDTLQKWLSLAEEGEMSQLAKTVVKDTYRCEKALNDPRMAESIVRRNKLPNAKALLQKVLLNESISVSKLATQLASPVLFVQGSEDNIGPVEEVQAIADSVSHEDVQVTVVEGAGHVVFMERPREWCEAVTNFLEGACEGGETDGAVGVAPSA